MKFDFNLDYNADQFKDIMKYFRHAPLLFYPFMFTQPAFAGDMAVHGDLLGGFFNVEEGLLFDYFKEF